MLPAPLCQLFLHNLFSFLVNEFCTRTSDFSDSIYTKKLGDNLCTYMDYEHAACELIDQFSPQMNETLVNPSYLLDLFSLFHLG